MDTLIKAHPNVTVNASGWANARQLVRKANGELWCVYRCHDGSRYQIYVGYSTDQGLTWTEEQVSYATGSYHQSDAAIAVDSEGNVHVTWTGLGWGGSPGSRQVQYRKRTSAGWQAQEAITDFPAPSASNGHAMAVDSNGNVHVAYDRSGLRYRKRTSAGWQDEEQASTSGFFVSMAIDNNGYVHLAYEGGSRIRHRERTSSWGTEEEVNESTSEWQRYPCIAVDTNDNIHVAWVGKGWGVNAWAFNVQYRKKTTGGWQAQEQVTDKAGNQQDANVSLEKSTGYVWVTYAYFIASPPPQCSCRRRRTTSWQPESCFPQTKRNFLSMCSLYPDTQKPGFPLLGCAYIYFFNEFATVQVRYFTDSLVLLPVVLTDDATLVTRNSATLNDLLVDDGGEACDCGFEWGETIAYGNTTPTESKTSGGTFSQAISGLARGTLYHFRAFATNSGGTGYGEDKTFIFGSVGNLNSRELISAGFI